MKLKDYILECRGEEKKMLAFSGLLKQALGLSEADLQFLGRLDLYFDLPGYTLAFMEDGSPICLPRSSDKVFPYPESDDEAKKILTLVREFSNEMA